MATISTNYAVLPMSTWSQPMKKYRLKHKEFTHFSIGADIGDTPLADSYIFFYFNKRKNSQFEFINIDELLHFHKLITERPDHFWMELEDSSLLYIDENDGFIKLHSQNNGTNKPYEYLIKRNTFEFIIKCIKEHVFDKKILRI